MSEPPAGPLSDEDAKLARSVAERAARRAYWQAHGERSLGQNLAMIGALGWLVITPTLAGLFVGRWLDHIFTSGIFWTGALLVVGVTLGCAIAWRRVRQIQQEDEP
ncbi:MAG TPA: AtpZ/AtpI family protein [Caulobacteraceae bacterium]|nr:AtpZ/AtpI family protein [Caulobacteraceae bacterium]